MPCLFRRRSAGCHLVICPKRWVELATWKAFFMHQCPPDSLHPKPTFPSCMNSYWSKAVSLCSDADSMILFIGRVFIKKGKKMTKCLMLSSRGVSTVPEILCRCLYTCQLALGDRSEIWGLTCSPAVSPSDLWMVLADGHHPASAGKHWQGKTAAESPSASAASEIHKKLDLSSIYMCLKSTGKTSKFEKASLSKHTFCQVQ